MKKYSKIPIKYSKNLDSLSVCTKHVHAVNISSNHLKFTKFIYYFSHYFGIEYQLNPLCQNLDIERDMQQLSFPTPTWFLKEFILKDIRENISQKSTPIYISISTIEINWAFKQWSIQFTFFTHEKFLIQSVRLAEGHAEFFKLSE